MSKKLKDIGNYFVDENGNKFTASLHTPESALRASESLVDCYNCIDCVDCKYCHGCEDCKYCRHCEDCEMCTHCEGCTNCRDCINCTDCKNCKYCDKCSYCNNCVECENCSECKYCSNCTDYKDDAPRNQAAKAKSAEKWGGSTPKPTPSNTSSSSSHHGNGSFTIEGAHDAKVAKKLNDPKTHAKLKAKASPGADIKIKMAPNLVNAASGKFYRGIVYEKTGEKPWKKIADIRVRP